jgi:hypothetical protein
MSTAENHDPSPPQSDLTADQYRAEALLFDLATTLRGVPVEECTRALHLRALTLRGILARWPLDQPDGPTREAFFGEVVALEREARYWRGRLRSGTQLAYRGRSGER